MLYADIKAYLLEVEEGEDEVYLQDLEECSGIDSLIQVYADYYGIDEYEASRMILNKLTN